MLTNRPFIRPSCRGQFLSVSQPPRRAFSPSTCNHPRYRTPTRASSLTESPQNAAIAEESWPDNARHDRPRRRDSRGQPKSKEDFLRSFQGSAVVQPRLPGLAAAGTGNNTAPQVQPGHLDVHKTLLSHRQPRTDAVYARGSYSASSGREPDVPPTVSSRIIRTPQDIWSSQMVYLDTSRRASSSASSLQVSSSSSPATSAATSFFAASRPTFLYSSGQLRTTPTNSAIPEIAIIGASNVGKSSFLNALVSGLPGQPQQALARTSAQAGHTRTMNAYGVGPNVSEDPVLASRIKKRLRAGSGEEVPKHSLVLVDTPGYGFRSQKEWGDGIIGFLEKRTMLKGVVVLIAAEKSGLGQFDCEVLKMVSGLDKGVLVIVTKGDKLGKLGLDRKKKVKKSGVEGDGNHLHAVTVEKLREIEAAARRACRSGSQSDRLVPRIYLTAADMVKDKKWTAEARGGNKGVAGARAAILELAGLAEERVKSEETDGFAPEKRADMASPEAWGGQVIPFEELDKMYEQKNDKQE